MSEAAPQSAPAHALGSLAQRAQGAPLLWASGAAVLLYAPYVAVLLALGEPHLVRDPDALFGISDGLRIQAVLCAVFVYTTWVQLHEPARLAREGPALRAALEERGAASAELRVRRVSPRALCAGAAVGVSISLLGSSTGPAPWPVPHLVGNLVIQSALFASMGQLASTTRATTRAVSRLAREHARVDLLEPRSLAVFARQGLRFAFYWFTGSGIALLLTVENASPEIALAVIAVTVGIGVTAVLSTTRGVRVRLAEAKRRELTQVRGEIRHSREALSAAPGPGAGDRLPALLAWEARVGGISEWPFDAPTLVRFVLLALIPLGSWLGGAVVERVVDSLLG